MEVSDPSVQDIGHASLDTPVLALASPNVNVSDETENTDADVKDESKNGESETQHRDGAESGDRSIRTSNPASKTTLLNQQTVDELKSMGFSAIRSEKAVYCTNSSGVEAAVYWLEEHADDSDLDVPIDPEVKSKLTKDEALAKAYELQKKLREERTKREKQEALDKERLRIEGTKIALDQQRKLEEEERKRTILDLQREKVAHQKEKERQRELLKKEWEERFGVPYDAARKLETAEDAKKSLANKCGKDQIIHWCSKLKKTYKDQDKEGLVRCLTTIKTYVSNAFNNPTETKYHRIKKENNAFHTRLAPYEGAVELLECVGFKDDGSEFYTIVGCPDGFLLGQALKFIDIILRQL